MTEASYQRQNDDANAMNDDDDESIVLLMLFFVVVPLIGFSVVIVVIYRRVTNNRTSYCGTSHFQLRHYIFSLRTRAEQWLILNFEVLIQPAIAIVFLNIESVSGDMA